MVALFVVLTFVSFVVADGIVQWVQAKQESTASLIETQHGPSLENVRVPGSVFLDSTHTWLSIDRRRGVRVGADAFAALAVGKIDEVVVPTVGQEIQEGDTLFSLRQGKRNLSFPSPVSGTIKSVNQQLLGNSEPLERNPYSDGWICRVEPKNLSKSLKRLKIGEEATTWLREQVVQLREFLLLRNNIGSPAGMVAQDGGQLARGVLESMDDDVWNEFSDKFLSRG